MKDFKEAAEILYPITVEKLDVFGPPTIVTPAPGILAIVADYSNDTIDITVNQARDLHRKLGGILEACDDD